MLRERPIRPSRWSAFAQECQHRAPTACRHPETPALRALDGGTHIGDTLIRLMRRILSALVLPLLLVAAGCVRHPYHPLDNGGGYYDQSIGSGRYKVSFSGGYFSYSVLQPEVVESYLFRRCAEVTLAADARWFVVLSRDDEPEGGGGVSPQYLRVEIRVYETEPKHADRVYDAEEILSRPMP